ncbi:MAG TPA: hypothetical protein VHY35_06400 [Stellaceae bacterium]|jgi:hypothetical protein|nr:hypothetical protein [Stellaceae bacterium]
MNQTIYRHIISFATTFLATFVTVFGALLLAGLPDHPTTAIVAGLALSAVRAAFKAAFEGAGLSGDTINS